MKMAQQSKQPQGREALLKSYNKRLKDDVKSILDNFMEIVKLGLVEESQISRMTQVEEINFQMQVRSANMVRAAESLMKLVADVKQYLILNDFPSVNEAITQNSLIFKTKSQEADQKLMALRDDMASDLYELEEEFYSSIYKEKWSYDAVEICNFIFFVFKYIVYVTYFSLRFFNKIHIWFCIPHFFMSIMVIIPGYSVSYLNLTFS